MKPKKKLDGKPFQVLALYDTGRKNTPAIIQGTIACVIKDTVMFIQLDSVTIKREKKIDTSYYIPVKTVLEGKDTILWKKIWNQRLLYSSPNIDSIISNYKPK